MKTLCMNFKIVLHQNEFTFFSDVLICLFESQLQRDERESSLCWLTPQDGHNNQNPVRLKSGARSFFQVTHEGSGLPSTWTISQCLFSGCQQGWRSEVEQSGQELVPTWDASSVVRAAFPSVPQCWSLN